MSNTEQRSAFEHWARSMDLPLEGGQYGVVPNVAWVYADFTTDTAYKSYCAALSAQSAVQEPVAVVDSWTNGSYHRNYKLTWLKDVAQGQHLYTHPSSAAQVEEIRNAVNAALEKAAQICAKEAREWNSDAQISDKNYAGACTLQIRALKTTAPSKGEE